ncbi:hypothetical protein ACFSC3_05485 [Sphingomonas floccifaciens]|uniref:Alkaline proteinase inhibitor/ Outer membrane lipoprotein Omp19 domain-containing protein n=1 Tax=Sphingomonas floccifaciens TaxID=1844115 RepID=A0ABW4NBU5_9SPHN
MIVPLLLALSASGATPPPPTPCAPSLPADRLTGRWVGPFAGAEWTFELKREGTRWSGRYQSSRSPAWHPLEDVSVNGGCATFSLKSEPRLTFVLALGGDGATLAGDLKFAGRATLPFAAKRVS